MLRFCAYRERCTSEVKKKLREMGARPQQAKELLHMLQQENFLNDRRFAFAFAGDKFRLNKWGRNKIRLELRARQLPPELVTEALQSIDGEEYRNTLLHLAERKAQSLGKLPDREIRLRVFAYLHGKGFESDLIKEILEIIRRK